VRPAEIHARRGSTPLPITFRPPDEDEGGEDRDESGRIRCPLCSWRPTPASEWWCVSVGAPEHFPQGCGTAWNTFMTRGRCPGCRHQWRYTSCLRCSGWSLHTDWYEDDGDQARGTRR
jgi:hypothetical protein